MSSAPSPATSATHPRRSALKADGESDRTPPLSAAIKAVQIAEPELPSSSDDSPVKKQFPAGLAKRLSGRPPPAAGSSRASTISQSSFDGAPGDLVAAASSTSIAEDTQQLQQSYHRHRLDRVSEKLLTQVAEWVQREKVKRESKKSRRPAVRRQKSPPLEKTQDNAVGKHLNKEVAAAPGPSRLRAASIDSDSSEVSLDRLQRILDDSMAALGLDSVSHLRRKSHHKKHHKNLSLTRTASSDTEFFDGDVVVQGCDAFLDNSKTLSYLGGMAINDSSVSISGKKEEKEKQAWLSFKNEIIRIAHTLRLKGWRRVPLDSGDLISVERLSGALTNAVYVVSPPSESVLPREEGKKQPTKVLLRIYGPQVEHLIDRETELSVLRRLARKKIGPRLLGTFLNGRFEQFFNATTLTPADLRQPETSKQIAKRMRELHDGVDLLEEEKDQGPAVWKNWDKWLNQAEKTVMFLDKQILGPQDPIRTPAEAWRARGFVCGVEWSVFKGLVDKYRKFLGDYYGGDPKKIRQRLVFAHNDTQYGNILRIRPDDEKSPLLQPANEHKQLIVIDFEYAAANVPGLEFANHFSEWTYNYHDLERPWACDTTKYPTPEQQQRFIKAYIGHKPRYNSIGGTASSTPSLPSQPATPSGTTGMPPLHSTGSTTSIVEFMLDARVPPGGWKEEESRHEKEFQSQASELLEEARLWRTANSAMWVSWGLIQAKIPGLKLLPSAGGDEPPAVEDVPGDIPVEAEEEEEAAFDYLAYAQDRAYFFLGDCVLLGLISAEELPEDVRSRLKIVHY
ncbi:kinase-like domain-containing protein [Podospora didyma]|uniref:Kinase-like domain-containing protein n=1 Tax=Podospora didyma TaxID=330526 RepID=A0AAE0P4B4_9PEZI|nr:kinase-like domain-containing protein [Podospora didyma]